MKANYIHQDTRTLSNTITGEIQTLSRWQDPTIEEYKKEIERLNNIIDELEKYLEEEKDERYSWHYREWIRQVQDKLKELKGSEE